MAAVSAAIRARRRSLCGEGVGDDQVGDVDDRDGEVLVDAVAVDQPRPAASLFALDGVVEGAALDEAEGRLRRSAMPSGPPRASPRTRSLTEEVGVDEEVEDLVDGDVSDRGGGREACVGQVVVVGARVGSQPLPDRQDVVAGLGLGDGEGLGDLVGVAPRRRSAMKARSLGHVWLALGQGLAASGGPHRDRAGGAWEARSPRGIHMATSPSRVGSASSTSWRTLVAHAGGEGLEVLGRRGGGLDVGVVVSRRGG
jgi:hypothetical protein